MKKELMMAAILIATAAAAARAGQNGLDFDGAGPAVTLARTFETAAVQLPEAANPAPAAKSAPVAGKVTIDAAIYDGGTLREESLVCDKGDKGAAVKDCRRRADGSRLTAADIRSLKLEHYFTPRGLSFRAMLGEAESAEKSRYCHNPVKECDAWKTEGKRECTEWSEPTPSGYRKCLAMDWVYYDVCAHYSTYCDD